MVEGIASACGGGPEVVVEKFRLCSGCRAAKYCSATCQKLDWKAHKQRCKQAQAIAAAIKAEKANQKELNNLAKADLKRAKAAKDRGGGGF